MQAAGDGASPAQGTAFGVDASGADGRGSAAWAELERAEMARSGALLPAWAQALGAVGGALVQIVLSARQGDIAFETQIGLLPGLGLTRTQRVALAHGPDGRTPMGREEAVEILAFPPERLWEAVARVLPPTATLRSPAAPTPSGDRVTLALPEAVAGRLPELVDHERIGRTAGEILLAEVNAAGEGEWSRLLADPDAEVGMVVGAKTGPEDFQVIGVHRWFEVDSDLYHLVTADAPRVEKVLPGALAHELVYLVTGAYGAAAGAVAR